MSEAVAHYYIGRVHVGLLANNQKLLLGLPKYSGYQLEGRDLLKVCKSM